MYYESYVESEQDALYFLTGGQSGAYWETEVARIRLNVLWAIAPILRQASRQQNVTVLDWKGK